jgi:hypothetical protein
MIAVVALAFTSCKKNNDEDQAQSCMGYTEQFMSVDEGLEKVYLDENNMIYFEEKDTILVYNIDQNTSPENLRSQAAFYRAKSSGNSVSFGRLKVAPGGYENTMNKDMKDAFYAFYPGQNVTFNRHSSTSYMDDNFSTFRLDATQEYRNVSGKILVPKRALYMAAKEVPASGSLNDVQFGFRNICGILSMKMYHGSGEVYVKSIAIRDRAFNLVGDVYLKINAIDPDELTSLLQNYDYTNPSYVAWLNQYKDEIGYMVTNAGRTVTLNCGADGVKLGKNQSNASRFLVVLRPLALRDGCDITVTYKIGAEGEWQEAQIHSSISNTIRPNTIVNATAFDLASYM